MYVYIVQYSVKIITMLTSCALCDLQAWGRGDISIPSAADLSRFKYWNKRNTAIIVTPIAAPTTNTNP